MGCLSSKVGVEKEEKEEKEEKGKEVGKEEEKEKAKDGNKEAPKAEAPKEEGEGGNANDSHREFHTNTSSALNPNHLEADNGDLVDPCATYVLKSKAGVIPRPPLTKKSIESFGKRGTNSKDCLIDNLAKNTEPPHNCPNELVKHIPKAEKEEKNSAHKKPAKFQQTKSQKNKRLSGDKKLDDSNLPYCLDVYIPFTDDTVIDFLKANDRLKTASLPCKISLTLNDFIWLGERRKRIRVESFQKEELIQCVDLIDSIFPDWKVWNNGNVPGLANDLKTPKIIKTCPLSKAEAVVST